MYQRFALCVGFICLSSIATAISRSKLYQNEANGSEAVLLAVSAIHQSEIFGSDNDLLRRIAYVETRDGNLPNTFRESYNGGLWAVDEDAFISTKNVVENPRLRSKIRLIQQRLRINWLDVQWSDLRRPLYSALAAQIIIYNAPRFIPPASDSIGQAQFWLEYYNRDGDITDFVTTSAELEGSIIESAANEFFIGFSVNADVQGSLEPSLQLFVTTPESSLVQFTVMSGEYRFTGEATSNSSTIVNLPHSLQVRTSTERNKGIHVKAEGERKIVVYGLSYEEFTTDAFLALPCSSLASDEYVYYGMTYSSPSNDVTADILIVGCENNTIVTTPTSSILINRLESYLIQSRDSTGMRISSSRPISFFSNHECTNIPSDVLACDHLSEQIPPTSTWGRSFFVASLLGRSSGEIFRIMAAKNLTTVTVNCTTFRQVEVYNLPEAGDWQEFEIRPSSFCIIESSSPILVNQFARGNGFDSIGDPFMMMIPPIEQYSNSYVFNVLPSFSTNYITVYVAMEHYQPNQIFVDNSIIHSLWVSVYCSNGILCGYITRMPLAPGEHSLFHQDSNARIGVSAYGFNSFNSYGYPGGLKLVPIQLAMVSFTSPNHTVSESVERLDINIIRSGDTEVVAHVLVTTDKLQGTASVNEDYTSISTIVQFQAGETEAQIQIQIRNDRRIERNETFQLYLTAGIGVHLSPFPRTEIIIENDDGMIILDPPYGNMLGGTGVIVTGHRLVLSSNDDVMCTFDGIQTLGTYVSRWQALCVSPMLMRTGRVDFTLHVTGTNTFTGEGTFTSLSYSKAFDVYLENDDLLFSDGDVLNIRWSPISIFPIELPNTYNVDIDLLEMNLNTGVWENLISLASNIPNTGFIDIPVPDIEERRTLEDSVSLIVVRVSLSIRRRRSSSEIFRRLALLGLKTIHYSPVRYLMKLASRATQRKLCEMWDNSQPPNISQAILNQLPPCPTRIRDIRSPNSGFIEERLSSLLPVIGPIQTKDGNLVLPFAGMIGDNFGYILSDDTYREFFHPGTTNCFHQRATTVALSGGSRQQCCYNRQFLVTGPPGGGTVDLVSPDVSKVRHFISDIIPYLLCCKAEEFSNCGKYYDNRPSDRGIDYSPPPPPARMLGDPHIVTLDGHQYTFNGKGEYILIDTPNDTFSLQARMVPITGVQGNTSQGTVFIAIVCRQHNSDVIQFEITENGTIILVNGGHMDFTLIKEQEFNNVTVSDLGNNIYAASFSSGVYLELKEEDNIISGLMVSLPHTFQESETHGLMGSFNGNVSDDLLPNFSNTPLPLNSSLQDIHELFGVTWIIDTPSDSLFTYKPGQNWATYYNPFFVPAYTAVFSDPELEHQAREICGDDQLCLFDIAATGKVEIGQSTLIRGLEFEEIISNQIPVLCSTPCEYGACIANDTCYCAPGIEGRYCTEPVYTECEENPCQNGGSCVKHVMDHLCTCPPRYTGDLCQTAIEKHSITAVALTGIVVGVVGAILILEIAVCLMIRKNKIGKK